MNKLTIQYSDMILNNINDEIKVKLPPRPVPFNDEIDTIEDFFASKNKTEFIELKINSWNIIIEPNDFIKLLVKDKNNYHFELYRFFYSSSEISKIKTYYMRYIKNDKTSPMKTEL